MYIEFVVYNFKNSRRRRIYNCWCSSGFQNVICTIVYDLHTHRISLSLLHWYRGGSPAHYQFFYATVSTNIELSSKDTLHFCHRLRFVITTNTGNTLLHVPVLHCDWPYEMASSPLSFPFSPTTTSYRAGAIFKFEMCQSAPPHPVFINNKERNTIYKLMWWYITMSW